MAGRHRGAPDQRPVRFGPAGRPLGGWRPLSWLDPFSHAIGTPARPPPASGLPDASHGPRVSAPAMSSSRRSERSMLAVRRQVLFNPGPVNLDPRIKDNLFNVELCHREPVFDELAARIRTGLLSAAGYAAAEFEVSLLHGSGTLAVDAALASLVPRSRRRREQRAVLPAHPRHFGRLRRGGARGPSPRCRRGGRPRGAGRGAAPHPAGVGRGRPSRDHDRAAQPAGRHRRPVP